MSCCYVPGQVVVVPPSGDGSGDDTAILYSAKRWIATNDLLGGTGPSIPAPRVHRVRVGDEHESARRLVEAGKALAALPNYFIKPAQARGPALQSYATLNEQAIRRATESWQPLGSPVASRPVVVLVLDSGYLGTSPVIRKIDACDDGDQETPYSSAHGTVVCELIHRVAPFAEIIAARVVGRSSTLASFLTGLYLAEQTNPPDIINVSLELTAERGCRKCSDNSAGDFTECQLGKACAAITSATRASPPVWIAAAGNDTPVLALPARLANVIAVGSYDPIADARASYSIYVSPLCGA